MNTKTQTNQFGMVQVDKNRGSIRSSTAHSGRTCDNNVNNICDNNEKASIAQGVKENNNSMCNCNQNAVTDCKYE